MYCFLIDFFMMRQEKTEYSSIVCFVLDIIHTHERVLVYLSYLQKLTIM